jgi:hypothetical protein
MEKSSTSSAPACPACVERENARQSEANDFKEIPVGFCECKKASHTPGPWFVADEGFCPGIDADGENIIFNSSFGEYCGVRGVDRKGALANARLIAAAPELLEALKHALAIESQQAVDDGRHSSLCDAWEALISSAS